MACRTAFLTEDGLLDMIRKSNKSKTTEPQELKKPVAKVLPSPSKKSTPTPASKSRPLITISFVSNMLNKNCELDNV